MTPGEIILACISGLLVLTFGLWARRLDKALDLLESIQSSIHSWMVATEHRLTKLESFQDRTERSEDDYT